RSGEAEPKPPMRPHDKGQGASEGPPGGMSRQELIMPYGRDTASTPADGLEASGDYLWSYWLNNGETSPILDPLLCGISTQA
ncbi:hypothetical protein HispidOSU_018784, partial [Sigmodon hispidus]